MPGSTLDLRIQPGDFIPHYFWSVDVEPSSALDLGSLELREGASIAGWVAAPDDATSEEPAAIELAPRLMGWHGNPKEGRRARSRNLSTRTTDRGFFQLDAIPPGGYTLTASRSGFADAVVPEIDIDESGETFLEDPLILEPLGVVEIHLDPPVDPRGRPWIIRLGRRQRAATHLHRSVDESPATSEGRWIDEELQHGTYFAMVSDVDGSGWWRESIEVHARTSPIFLTIPVVPVEGRLTLGDEPLEASLVFGTTQGEERIRLRTDDEGEFEGHLPREGRWPVEIAFDDSDWQAMAIEPVEVERSPGQRVARLEIELPDTRLEGRVVAQGEPVPEALVTILRQDEGGEKKSRQAVLVCDGEGEFEIFGFPPGSLLVHGNEGTRSSPWIQVEIQEGLEAPELVLEISETIEVAGQVVFGDVGVPGAQILAQPIVSDPGSFVVTAEDVSTVDGGFSLSLPAATVAMDVLVVPPGFAAHWLRVPVGADSMPPIIPLTAAAGTLRLKLPASTIEAVLHFEGSSMPVSLLLSTMLPLGRVAIDDVVSFTQMKPGEYSYCQAGECSSGYLAPASELSLGP